MENKHRLFKLFAVLLTCWSCASAYGAESVAGAGNEPVTVSFQAGQSDKSGHYLGGTELLNLAAFDGRLFAGVGYWEDPEHGQRNPSKQAPGPQIIALDSASGEWRQDVAFDELVNERRRYLRVTALQVIKFANTMSTSGKVKVLPKPVSMLVVGMDGQTAAGGGVFIRVGESKSESGEISGNWVEMPMPDTGFRLQSFRSFIAYRDPITGLDRIFVGVGAQKDDMPGAIFSGYYDPSLPGKSKIHWDALPEFSGFQHRVMSFVAANGKLYFAAKPSLYERTTGGTKPKWRECYTYPLKDKPPVNRSIHSSGLRGLTAIDDPAKHGHKLILTAYEGVPGDVLRIDPAKISNDDRAIEELRTYPFLRSHWIQNKRFPQPVLGGPAPKEKRYVLLAYNEMLKIDSSAGPIRVLPLDAHSPNPGEESSAWFLTRKEGSTDASGYRMHEVKPIEPSRKASSDPSLFAIRTFLVSPFPEDHGKVLYFGGYDGHSHSSHNTAWLYRGGVDTLLQDYTPAP